MEFEKDEEGKLTATIIEKEPEEKSFHFEKTFGKRAKEGTEESVEKPAKKKMGKLKKLLIAVAFLVVAFIIFALIYGGAGTLKRELKKYVEESVPMFASIESDYAETYSEAMTNPNVSDSEAYDLVTKTCIPKIDALLETLRSLKIRHDELEKLHDIYIDYIEKVRNMLQVTKEAYEEYSREKALTLTELSKEALEVGNRYYTELEELCKREGVEVPE